MLKKELRLDYTARRNSLSREDLISSTNSILTNLESMSIWDFNYYHVFLSIAEKNEIDTDPLISLLRDRNKKIVVPRVAGDHELEHFQLNKETRLQNNQWGIPEPVEGTSISEELIDLVFIPLLAFDHKGQRVGYGKGYYDRFLKRCKPEVVKVGLSLFEATEKISDAGDTDVALDYCVTPTKIYAF